MKIWQLEEIKLSQIDEIKRRHDVMLMNIGPQYGNMLLIDFMKVSGSLSTLFRSSLFVSLDAMRNKAQVGNQSLPSVKLLTSRRHHPAAEL